MKFSVTLTKHTILDSKAPPTYDMTFTNPYDRPGTVLFALEMTEAQLLHLAGLLERASAVKLDGQVQIQLTV